MSDWRRISSGAIVLQKRGVGFSATTPSVAERDLWITRVCDRVFIPLGVDGFSPANSGKLEAAGIEPASDLSHRPDPTAIKPRTHIVTGENHVDRRPA